MKFVFLSGKSGAGKDLAASYLASKHGFIIFRIADIIKKLTADLTNVPLEECYNKKDKVPTKELGFTLGEYQQKIGKALRKEIHPDVFLIHLWNKITIKFAELLINDERVKDVLTWDKKIMELSQQKIVIVDGRLKNEYDFFVGKKAVTVRINRKFELRKKHLAGRDPNHETEVALDNEEFDYVIENNSTIKEDLYKKLDMFIH